MKLKKTIELMNKANKENDSPIISELIGLLFFTYCIIMIIGTR